MKTKRDFELIFKESDSSEVKAINAIFKSIDSIRKEQKNEKQQTK